MGMLRTPIRGVRSPVRSPLLRRATGLSIADGQTDSFGALTLEGHGDWYPEHTGTISSVVINSGDASGHFEDNGSGALVPTATGAGSLSGPYSLNLTYNGSVTVDVTINTEANVYSASSMADVKAAVVDIGTGGGKTIKCRSGTYSSDAATFKNRAFTSEVILTSYESQGALFVAPLDVRNTDNLTIDDVTVFGNGTAGSLVIIRDGSDTVTVQNSLLYDDYIDPEGDYSSAQPVRRYGINKDGTTAPVDVTIKDNEIRYCLVGVSMGCSGTLTIQGNFIHNVYEDCLKIGPGSSSTLIKDNFLAGVIASGSDAGNPHPDFIQFLGHTADWTGIEIDRNTMVDLYTRAAAQGIFLDDMSSGFYYVGKIRGNAAINSGNAGITVRQAKDCEVYGNTLARANIAESGTLAILIGDDTTSGTHTVKNNVADSITVSGTSDESNNIESGAGGATLAYFGASGSFAGSDDDPETTLSEIRSKYTMKLNGRLDADTSGGPSVGDIGAIGSGYVTWASANPGSSGGALDDSYIAYEQNFVDNQGTAYLSSTSLGASDSAVMTFCTTINMVDTTTTTRLFLASGRTDIHLTGGNLKVEVKSTSNTTLYDATGTTTLSNGTDYHIHVEVDLGGTPSVTVTINGATETMTVSTAATTGTIDHTRTSYSILDSAFDGNISDYFVDFTQAIDVSSFYSSGALDISAVGSPAIFLGNDMTADERAGNASQGWNDGYNLGSGGTLTVTNTFVDV